MVIVAIVVTVVDIVVAVAVANNLAIKFSPVLSGDFFIKNLTLFLFLLNWNYIVFDEREKMTENKKKSGLKTRLTNLVKRSKKAAVIGAAITTMAVGGKANAAVGSPMRHGYQPVVDVVPAPSVQTPVVAPTPVTPSYSYNRPQRQGCNRGRVVLPHRGPGRVDRPMFGVGSRGGVHGHRGHMHHTLRGHSVGGGHRVHRAPMGGRVHSAPHMNRGGGRNFGPRDSRGGGFAPRGGRGRR